MGRWNCILVSWVERGAIRSLLTSRCRYCYAILFYTQIISAAGFTDYWNVKQVWQIIAFYCIAPLVVLGINFAGVKWFGIVETIGGILKVITVVGGGIFMYVISGQPGGGQGDCKSAGATRFLLRKCETDMSNSRQ